MSLPLSPDQRSSSPADVSAGSSFPQPPSSSSDLAQCVGMEQELPAEADTWALSDKKESGDDEIGVTVYHKYIWRLVLYPATHTVVSLCLSWYFVGKLTTICSSVLLLKASSKRLALSLRLWF